MTQDTTHTLYEIALIRQIARALSSDVVTVDEIATLGPTWYALKDWAQYIADRYARRYGCHEKGASPDER